MQASDSGRSRWNSALPRTEMIKQFIAGKWRQGSGRGSFSVRNPATGGVTGEYPWSSDADIDDAVMSAERGFQEWSAVPHWTRHLVLLKVADHLQAHAIDTARAITKEQGKPLFESVAEVERAADFFRWAAGQGVRVYDRVIPSRVVGERHVAARRPVGVVCALTPWNYPIVLPAKKISAALAAGCSVILKASEETPSGAIAIVEACLEAGVPGNAINLLMGNPEQISNRLIAHPIVKKISFTGSISVGKHLASKAGAAMKPCTLELGGHAPVIVMDDVDAEAVARLCVQKKFSNAGQACISPSRFLVHSGIYEEFSSAFLAASSAISVGSGEAPGVTMGPLANARRLQAISSLVEDCRVSGADILTGGVSPEGEGYFYPPTVIHVSDRTLRIMNEEPFGPTATISMFKELADMVEEANRLPVGLAAYAFTSKPSHQSYLAEALQAGLVGINLLPGHLPEDPFGGWKESGFGLEGGEEGIDAYLSGKLVCSSSYC